ncbi:Membrane protein involved in the export of O-antigen and teichoic acid [Lachnospiraceae bacterium XPB1003]|nr:Membrane protein involved in the export of O-antigen and teichoic acid [Lachnospiraceae bacterium XPB1003]
MNSIRRNLVYNILYQILVMFLPIITVPYISRTLGKVGVGIFSYTYSIVYYFMLITLLGIENHGNRMIARVRSDKEELSKTFLGIYSIQITSGLLMVVSYVVYMLFINKKYEVVSWIQIIYLISAIFDINWFFFGLEEFKITVTRNTLVKVLSLFLIFVFVKGENGLFYYTLIMSLSTCISQMLLIPILLKRISFFKIGFRDVKKHLRPVFVLFFPVVVVSIYTVMDKIMLGELADVSYVGIYEQANKMVKIPLSIITALGTVMLPRISNLVSMNQKDKVIEYIEKSVKFMMFLAFPMWLGLVSIADKFIPLFLGSEFLGASEIVKLMSIVIVFISFANITRTQYLIPYERDKDYIISTSIGAVVNFVLNLLLIPVCQAVGACIGTIGAEMVVMLYQCIALKDELPLFKYARICVKYFIGAIVMYCIIGRIDRIKMNDAAIIILQVVIGIVIYGSVNFKYIKKLMIK